MRVKQKNILMVLALLFVVTFCAGIFGLYANRNAAAQIQAKSAEIIATQYHYDRMWQNMPFGQNGYVVFTGNTPKDSGNYTGRTVYSNLYTEQGEGFDQVTDEIFLYNSTNSNDNNDWAQIVKRDSGIYVNAAESLELAISKWALNAETYQSRTELAESSLFKPNSTEPTGARVQNNNSTVKHDMSVVLDKTSEEDLWVTLFITNWQNSIKESNPADIYVFDSCNLDPKDESGIDFNTRYGDTSAYLAKTTVTKGNAYVTFKLSGTGTFQIVAADGEVGSTGPYIGGFFLDNKNPVGSDASYTGQKQIGTEWAGSYGADGYVLLSGSKDGGTTNGEYFYTDQFGEEYIDQAFKGKRDLKATDNVTYPDGTSKAPEYSADSIISGWGISSEVWAWHNDMTDVALKTSDGSATTGLRMHNTRDLLNSSVAMYFTAKEATYVSVYVYNYGSKSGEIDVSLYGGSFPSNGFNWPEKFLYKDGVTEETKEAAIAELEQKHRDNVRTLKELYGTPIATTKVTGVDNNNTIGKFVTFKVDYAGTYMIVASHTNEGYTFTNSVDGNGKLTVTANVYGVQPSLGGLFFDKTSPLADISHSITYVLDGGVCEENPDLYVEGVGVAAFEPAVKPGYTFQGWYTQAGGAGEKIESIPATATEDYTLYAYFTENEPCDITYHIENGTNAAENPAQYRPGIEVILADPIADEHFTFIGWYTTASFDEGTEITEISAESAGNVELYAKIVENPKFKINYVLDGGTNSPENPDYYYVGEGLNTIAPATKEGFEFKGWYTDAEFIGKLENIPADYGKEITLYACFEKALQSFTVAYNLDGGNNGIGNPDSYTEGDTIELAAASKDGYTFEGWYTTATFDEGTEITQITATQTGNLNLYAKFVKNSVNFTVTVNHSESGMTATVITVAEGGKLNVSSITAEGYKLVGLYTDAAFTNEFSADTPITADTTLYAKWEKTAATTDPDKDSGKDSGNEGNLGIILGVTGGVVLVVACVAVAVILKKKKSK